MTHGIFIFNLLLYSDTYRMFEESVSLRLSEIRTNDMMLSWRNCKFVEILFSVWKTNTPISDEFSQKYSHFTHSHHFYEFTLYMRTKNNQSIFYQVKLI